MFMSMRMRGKLYMAYFPFVLVCIQFLINVALLLGLDNPEILYYLNAMFGTNFFFAVFLVCYTNFFHFCRISKWASFAELALAIDVMVVKNETTYNLIFQTIIIICAIIATLLYYGDKFPSCMMSLYTMFLKKVIKNGFHCEKALEDFKESRYQIHKSNQLINGKRNKVNI